MFKTLKEVFDIHGLTKVDIDIYKKIQVFRIGWTQKAPEYIDFLGS